VTSIMMLKLVNLSGMAEPGILPGNTVGDDNPQAAR
jgi:hypothetical protein